MKELSKNEKSWIYGGGSKSSIINSIINKYSASGVIVINLLLNLGILNYKKRVNAYFISRASRSR